MILCSADDRIKGAWESENPHYTVEGEARVSLSVVMGMLAWKLLGTQDLYPCVMVSSGSACIAVKLSSFSPTFLPLDRTGHLLLTLPGSLLLQILD
jgi:hypothetical protein